MLTTVDRTSWNGLARFHAEVPRSIRRRPYVGMAAYLLDSGLSALHPCGDRLFTRNDNLRWVQVYDRIVGGKKPLHRIEAYTGPARVSGLPEIDGLTLAGDLLAMQGSGMAVKDLQVARIATKVSWAMTDAAARTDAWKKLRPVVQQAEPAVRVQSFTAPVPYLAVPSSAWGLPLLNVEICRGDYFDPKIVRWFEADLRQGFLLCAPMHLEVAAVRANTLHVRSTRGEPVDVALPLVGATCKVSVGACLSPGDVLASVAPRPNIAALSRELSRDGHRPGDWEFLFGLYWLCQFVSVFPGQLHLPATLGEVLATHPERITCDADLLWDVEPSMTCRDDATEAWVFPPRRVRPGESAFQIGCTKASLPGGR